MPRWQYQILSEPVYVPITIDKWIGSYPLSRAPRRRLSPALMTDSFSMGDMNFPSPAPTTATGTGVLNDLGNPLSLSL